MKSREHAEAIVPHAKLFSLCHTGNKAIVKAEDNTKNQTRERSKIERHRYELKPNGKEKQRGNTLSETRILRYRVNIRTGHGVQMRARSMTSKACGATLESVDQ